MALAYRMAGIGGPAAAASADVSGLQRDLRSLGYLRRGIDGILGDRTREAIRGLQFDLLHNDGSGKDGHAPVRVQDYNKGVVAVTGVVDPTLADSIAAMLADPAFPKLPRSADPAAANQAALSAITATGDTVVPLPFLLAICRQESGLQQYVVPTATDTDDFVVLGLDHGDRAHPDRITSRGYGIGQFTLFHHPPRPEEIRDVIIDPVANLRRAQSDLAASFHRQVAGPDSRADDRDVEHPRLDLRLCQYKPADRRYLVDCRACARVLPQITIDPATPLYRGAAKTYGDAPDYASPHYAGVPDRAAFLCDWPYAARRYNGGGPDSFNYQARVLSNLLRLAPQPGE